MDAYGFFCKIRSRMKGWWQGVFVGPPKPVADEESEEMKIQRQMHRYTSTVKIRSDGEMTLKMSGRY